MPSEWNNRIVGWDVVDPGQLIPHVENWRRHGPAQREALRGSLNDLGWIAPVLVSRRTGVVVDGHARVEEALTRGSQVPVAYLDLTEEEERKALLVLDPISAMADADLEALDALMHEVITEEPGLQAMLANLAKTLGLDAEDPDAKPDPGAQLDKADELQAKWATERGQLWEVGAHSIMCGDSTKAEDVARLLGGAVPHLMVTDPPYGVGYDPKWRVDAKRTDGRALSTGNVSMGEVTNDDQVDWTLAWELFPGDVAYVWHGGTHASEVARSLASVGLLVRAQIIWAKQALVIGRGHYHWQHEPCWYVVRKGGKSHWCGDRTQSTIWFISNAAGNGEKDDIDSDHGTQKPLECMRRPINNNSEKGDRVYDPFVGSGTTMVAAEQTGRICYGMEIEPKYVAVVLERLSGMGLEPRLVEVSTDVQTS